MPWQEHATEETVSQVLESFLPFPTLSLILALIVVQLLREPDQPVDLTEE